MISYFRKNLLKDRLQLLASSHAPVVRQELDSESILRYQQKLDVKLVEAGFLDPDEQLRISRCRTIVLLSGLLIGAGMWCYLGLKPSFLIVGAVLGLYFALVAWFIWLKVKSRDVLRTAYFDLPLILEELILLIESGLGLFPALEKICSYQKGEFVKNDPGVCRKSFKKAFALAVHGMPVSQAFAVVSKNTNCIPLKQVLIHLDVSASVGGELLTSLRALSDQVHKEWKMQVETRVKRLENMVIFPVFVAVMGLLLLTSSVPLVPVFNFMSSLKNVPTSSNSNHDELLNNGGTLK